MHKINVQEKGSCCGCTACVSICPQKAIVMKQDEEGFLYPFIMEEKCINCGLCSKVCQKEHHNQHGKPLKIMAVRMKDDEIRLNSSSGGVFFGIANYVEQQKGAIYGATFSKNFKVVHKRAVTRPEWKEFRTSKYVQSDLEDTFLQIRTDLLNDRWVLFVGTPCQVEGLKFFLKGLKTDKLITCDIVCHGVPSPKVWEDYWRYVQQTSGKRIGKVNFRDKSQVGWHNSTITFWENDTDKVILKETKDKNLYFLLFSNHFIIRPVCSRCRFTNLQRPGDFTLGDFWGIEKCHPQMDDNKGVSLLMLNTQKSYDVWEQINAEFEYVQVTETECLQPKLCEPSYRPPQRDLFWRAYHQKGIIYAAKRVRLIAPTIIEKVLFKIDTFLYRLRMKE